MPKPKLTKEEKKQMKIEKKRLKKLAAEEKKKQLKRDHLQREVEHGELSQLTLKKKWREMLLKIRLPEFRQDAEGFTLSRDCLMLDCGCGPCGKEGPQPQSNIRQSRDRTMWHKFDRALDLKNYVINGLLEEIAEDEIQYNTNMSANVDAIDKSILLFIRRLDELQAWYKREVADLKAIAIDSSTKIANQHEEDTLQMKTILFSLETQLKDAQYTAEGNYATKTTDEFNKYAEMHQILRGTLERTLDDTWGSFKSVLVNYKTSTDSRRKAFLELQVRDGQGGSLVCRQLKRMNYLQNLVRTLKDQLNKERQNQDVVLSDFRYERQYFADAYCTLRNRLKEERQLDFSQLIALTMESNLTVKYLTKIETKGEHILKFAAICRKLETQEEKITPFSMSFLDEAEELNIQTELGQKSSNMMLKLFDDFSDLEQFWRRVGEADLKRAQLRECRDKARAESQSLRNTLRLVMSGLTVVERVSVQQLSQPVKEASSPVLAISHTANATFS